jgi:flagellar assembly protein FliH
MSEFVNGILYAEDFGLARRVPPRRAPAPPPPPLPLGPAALTQADVDAACVRAVQAAEAAWSDSAAERRAEALAQVVAGIEAVRQEAGQQMEAAAEELARTVLGLVAGALPSFCRDHGDAEVRALVARLAPLLGRAGRLVVRVHPALAEVLAGDLAGLDEPAAGHVELRAANLPPGDLRLAWEDGSLVRDSGAICAALTEGLAEFGLLDTDVSNPGTDLAATRIGGPDLAQ